MKYCLKPKAKETLKETLKEVLITVFWKLPILILLVLSAMGLVTLPFVITQGITNNTFELVTGILGILSWTAIFSIITIGIKRWLQSNIIEC